MGVRKASMKARRLLASNLRQLRKARGFSQELLADRAGLHRTFVGSVERSERNVSIDNIERLATALEVAVADLFFEEPKARGR